MIRARLIFALAAALFIGAGARDGVDSWVVQTDLPPLTLPLSAEVVDRGGTLLRAYTVSDGRWRMAEGAVDPEFITMLLGYEDQRFYRHPGVDLIALVRATAQAIWNGRIISGGSTLTMQVARLLENSGTGRLGGKLRQIRVALALERRLTKPQILSLYLRLAPYGGNLEGVRAASLSYFGKEPRRLTPAQRALLVAIPQSPETRRPDRFVGAALDARARVLARAARDGLIDDAQMIAAQSEPILANRRSFPALAPHLADRARAENPAQMRLQLTLDAMLQANLETLAADTVAALGARVQVAILVADHRSGEILASVGSAEFAADTRAGFVDMTRALRSPGSTLKPLVYGLAFDRGLGHPETLINDAPNDFGGYRPQNFDRHFRGTIRMREALQQSLNIPVVAITDAIGPANLLAALDRAGMRYALPGGQAGLAISLGGIGVSLHDMVQLYAAMARGGVALPLISDLDAPRTGGQRVLSASAAWQVGDILAGLAPPPGAPRNLLAYKTGTSYGHRDAWAIGYDGAHVVGIWMGRPDGTPVPGAFGADLAAPLLFQAFSRLKPVPPPPPPPTTLMLSNAQLPPPLRQFRPRGAVFDLDAPNLSFPPDGSEVELLPEGLLLRVEGGTAPYIWLANGTPIVTGAGDQTVIYQGLKAGFVTLSVIDAQGQSARVTVRLRDNG